MRTIAVIPARFQSNRLPGKPLAMLHGKTMVERVYERTSLAGSLDRVMVATDDDRIFDAVVAFGGDVVMTSADHPSGTDRIAEAVADLDVDLVVNVQGDEPLIAPETIDTAVALSAKAPGAIVSLQSDITDRNTLMDRNVVKVVTDGEGFALYFSRSPIPVPPREHEELEPGRYFKHIGLYAYPKPVLIELTKLPPSPLEQVEKLEQLRALEAGYRIRMGQTSYDSIAVDTAADLDRVRALVADAEGQPSTVNRHLGAP